MKIGEAARQSGVTAKTIRYYEQIGLIPPPGRQDSGYRDYDRTDVHRLHFIKRARSLGFSIEQCRNLLSLYQDRGRASADVKAVAQEHLRAITTKITELKSMRDTLETLVKQCSGDDKPDCPILAELADTTPEGENP